MKSILKDYARTHILPLLNPPVEGRRLHAPESSASFLIAAFETSRGMITKKKKGKDRPAVVVCRSNQEAEVLEQEVAFFLGESQTAYFPWYEAIPYEYSGPGREISILRIQTLFRLLAGETPVIFTSPEGILRRMPSPERLRGLMLSLEAGLELSPSSVMTRLLDLGYERTDRVELPGEFCLKGSVLDIFPVNETSPVRLDYFDDEIETIKRFEPDTQRTSEKLDRLSILPSGEILLSIEESQELDRLLEKPEWKDLEKPIWENSATGSGYNQYLHPGIEQLFPLVVETGSVLDYLSGEALFFLAGAGEVDHRVEQILREYKTLYPSESRVRVCLEPEKLLTGTELAPEGSPVFRIDRSLEEGILETGLREPPVFHGRIREVRTEILGMIARGEKIFIASPYSAQINRIAGIFRTEKDVSLKILDDPDGFRMPDFTEDPAAVQIVRSAQRRGFEVPGMGFTCLTDVDIFGRSYRKRSRFKKSGSRPIESFLDLKEGDYVVHVNHGVGRFLALERVKAAGRERDFLVLEYAEEDRLFVPLDQISLIQKYSSPLETPTLDHLGKASFKKVKERVEKRVEEFAEKLIQIYAVRIKERGFAFPPDTSWQEEFESEFPYEETPDQISAIEAVKGDMESTRPMDRLVCGDVGYGKTEVAIRATFKAVMSGKQVALIAPTTILAMQHYRNFLERFANYPIQVDWISRFRSRAEITELKKRMKSGDVDVVIGTHSLISKEFAMKNLGLLVVDEEQRFGVAHKEAMKNVRKLVDVLTLTATPIPRTLHMSLVGIRDISTIQTPPRDRLPVRTFVMEDSDSVLAEAIQREIDRDGQVFYLHNRIESIDLVAERVRTLLPDLSIATLHGQMNDDEIEDILLDFLERKYDVLVTTSIIESGIDMPNVNTLIVDRADMFGLSQLYQIRGRVGRSSRQAYAYLFHQGGRVLTETAQKRLSTILEYQELGSGFKVAMRDLEIRGAGNVLGREQSGDIMEVGYELYIKLLEDAVKRLKGEDVEVDVRTSINLKTDFFLPEDYISDVRQRIEFYKRLEACMQAEEVSRIEEELEDRFGPLPEKAKTFILIERIRTLAGVCGFESVYETDQGKICLKAGEHFRVLPGHLIECLKSIPGLSVEPGSTNTLFFQPSGSTNDRLEETCQVLESITGPDKTGIRKSSEAQKK